MTFKPQHLDPYRGYAPTPYDAKGLAIYESETLAEGYVAPVSQTRDSGTLDRSTFAVVEKDLLQHHRDDAPVETHRFGHWGPRWYEIIVIHPDNAAALKAADLWACALADYAVADEQDWSAREVEAACEQWERMPLDDRMAACKRYNVSMFAARRNEIPEDPTGELISYLAV